MIKVDQNTIEIIAAISEILDIAETDILYHGWRVAYIAKNLSRDLCPGKENELLLTGLLHDFGSFDLPTHILHFESTGAKIRDGRALNHPVIGARIISSIPNLIPVAATILNHHERVDGEGYPRRIAGNEISTEAQIIRLADAISIQAYLTKMMDAEAILSVLAKESGKEFYAEYFDTAKKFLLTQKHWTTLQRIDLLDKEIDAEIHKIADPHAKPTKCCIVHILNFFGQVLDAKHHYAKGHSDRVADYALLIALACGLKQEDVEKVRHAAFLHDLGKIGVPIAILDKPGPLTDEEYDFIKKHPDIGVRIINKISLLKDLVPILNADQENYDGSGYPKGLKNGEIPLISRIVYVADAFDAMTSDRPYRKALPLEQALLELKASAKAYFDPDIVKIASDLFKHMNIH